MGMIHYFFYFYWRHQGVCEFTIVDTHLKSSLRDPSYRGELRHLALHGACLCDIRMCMGKFFLP